VCVCVCVFVCVHMHANSYLPTHFKESKGWRKQAQFLAGTGLFPLSPHPDQLSGPTILRYYYKLKSRKSELSGCTISLHIGNTLHMHNITYV